MFMNLAVCVLAVVTTTQAAHFQNPPLDLSPHPPAPPNYARRLNVFDVELLRTMSESVTGNFMISPASIKSVLTMLLEGAQGDCADQLREILRLPSDVNEMRNLLKQFMSKLKYNSDGVQIESANKVYVSNTYRINPKYEDVLKTYYNSEVESVPFSKPRVAAKTINDWVNYNTHGHITELVDSENLSADTIIVLANALYFKGTWESSFDGSLTSSKCFYKSNECIKTQMMENKNDFKYAKIDDSISAQVIELPYQGGKFSMVIILPTERNGLSTLVRDLTLTSIRHILTQLDLTDVQLTMPKFSIDYNDDLTPILKKMRIVDIFDSKANLTNMLFQPSGNPLVNSVAHRTRIEVNEEGSIAAAATGAMVIPLMGTTSAIMNIDHPFIFFIRDVETGAILFAGRYEQPNLASNLSPEHLNIFNQKPSGTEGRFGGDSNPISSNNNHNIGQTYNKGNRYQNSGMKQPYAPRRPSLQSTVPYGQSTPGKDPYTQSHYPPISDSSLYFNPLPQITAVHAIEKPKFPHPLNFNPSSYATRDSEYTNYNHHQTRHIQNTPSQSNYRNVNFQETGENSSPVNYKTNNVQPVSDVRYQHPLPSNDGIAFST